MMAPWLSLFLSCSLMLLTRPARSLRLLRRTGILLLDGFCLLKSWQPGKILLPSCLRSRRHLTRLFGLIRPLADSQLNLFTLKSSRVGLTIVSRCCGVPIFLSKSEFSFGKLLDVNFRSATKLLNARAMLAQPALFMKSWKTLNTSCSNVHLLSLAGVAFGRG